MKRAAARDQPRAVKCSGRRNLGARTIWLWGSQARRAVVGGGIVREGSASLFPPARWSGSRPSYNNERMTQRLAVWQLTTDALCYSAAQCPRQVSQIKITTYIMMQILVLWNNKWT